MPELIDKAQLQATAQVAKSFILEQDTNNVNTIINALQSSQSQSSTSAKLEPTLELITFEPAFSEYEFSYNGDGTVFGVVVWQISDTPPSEVSYTNLRYALLTPNAYHPTTHLTSTTNDFTALGESENRIYLFATATENCTAAFAVYTWDDFKKSLVALTAEDLAGSGD